MFSLADSIREAMPGAAADFRSFLRWSLERFGDRSDEYAEIQKRWAGQTYAKFLNFPYHARSTFDLMRPLLPANRILDLGCGPGYAQLIAEYHGRYCAGIDKPNIESGDDPDYGVLTDTRRFFGLSCIEHEIRPGKPLPETGANFDLVTGFAVNFDHGWSLADWKFLVADLRANHLRPGGRLFFQLQATRNDARNYIESLTE